MIAGRALARRLEADQALSLDECARALARLEPERGVAVLELGSARAAYGGPDSFFSEASGLGMDGPVADADLEALDEFYRSRSCRARVEICPLADPTAFVLAERGYRIREFHTSLVRPLAGEESAATAPAVPPGLEILPVTPAESERWVETCASGFVPDSEKAAATHVEFRALLAAASSRFSIALVDGCLAGAAAWGERDGLALLYATSVLPEFRGRGVHAALLARRLTEAREAGCDLAAGVALAGSGSQRNFERAGFRPAYTKVVMVREWE